MLKFFEQLTLDLMITAVITGMLYAFVKFKLNKVCKIAFLSGGGMALAASVFVAVQKNTNRELKLPFWNGFTYVLLTVLAVASVALILFSLLSLAAKRLRRITQYFVTAAAIVVCFTLIVNSQSVWFGARHIQSGDRERHGAQQRNRLAQSHRRT